MQNDFSVDVVIPCAGSGIYFEEALDSVLNQKLLPHKIYVVDNVSGHDRYYNIVKLKKTTLIEYIKLPKRLSMTENWQYCLELGKSKYFSFIHDDDVWNLNYLKDSIHLLESNTSSSIVLTAFHVFNEGDSNKKSYEYEKNIKIANFKKLESFPSEITSYILGISNSAHMSALVFKRASIGFPINSRWMPDQFFLSSYLIISDVTFVNKINCNIRLSPTNITTELVRSGFVSVETIFYIKNLTEYYIRNRQLKPCSLIKYTNELSFSYLKVLRQAVFSWPLNPLLLRFGMSMIYEMRIQKKKKFLINIPILFEGFFWILYSLRADFKYFLKDFNNTDKNFFKK